MSWSGCSPFDKITLILQKFRILHQAATWIAIEKPAGVRVHPPEDPRFRSQGQQVDVIRILRQQLGQRVYPVHRLDSATSGVLLMALDGETAGAIQEQFKSGGIEKTYVALVRGWTEDTNEICSPLTSGLNDGPEQEAQTVYETLFRFEIPVPSSKHSTSRFSLVQVSPVTGRYHQIRRHFSRISHPLIGDTVHGDGRQNRIWRELTGNSMLYLKAYRLSFADPQTHTALKLQSRWNGSWQRVFDRAGVCPFI